MSLDPYIEFVREKMNILSSFPKLAKTIYDAVKEALKEHGVDGEVYFFGSVIEGRFTAASDIDVAILVGRIPEERRLIVNRVFEILEDRGLPWWLPLEIHFFTPSMFNAFKKGGANFIKAEDYISQKAQ